MSGAVCEVGNCGVPAIGRCDFCGGAYCLSHRREPLTFYDRRATRFCVACIWTQHEQEKQHADKMAEELQEAKRVIVVLARQLSELDPSGGKMTYAQRRIRRRFWGYKTVNMAIKRVWHIGILDWYDSHTRMLPGGDYVIRGHFQEDTWIDSSGILWAGWEIYGTCRTSPAEIANIIRDKIRRIGHDPMA